MFDKQTRNELSGKYDAINRAQAVIEFGLDGTIITANGNFLNALGYSLNEVQGQHHRMFVEPAYAQSDEYRQFWMRLARGEYEAQEYKRVGKGGREVWIQASYNPIFDRAGNPAKIIKFATDITARKLKDADFQGQMKAIGKSQAVIEFNLDGTIINANDNFLQAVGYTLDEIRGQHHRMFVETQFAQSADYREFWEKLARGEYDSKEYKRLGKGGREIWIQATYNPIFDMNGKPFKVVKFASDITDVKLKDADTKGQMQAIYASQAVIHFNPDGTIITANDNFLSTMGYSLDEIEGKHHRMFVEKDFAESPAYKEFWEKLNRGEFDSRLYKRLGKGGREVWIQASYNPIFDLSGKLIKIVKFASDMTLLLKVSNTANDAVSMVQSVAAATEEMSASISEISKNMTLAKNATDNISKKTATSGEASDRLMQTMQSMENIVNLIRSIAGQVNLLALNATIEAARAGDAGRGFAVVASEVKNLATQTSKATDDIASEIAAVQTLSAEVSRSIGEIVEGVSQVSQYVTGVAGAIEEQTAVTQEISSNIQHANGSVMEISESIDKLVKPQSKLA